MHELLEKVLGERDLSLAGQLFNISDWEVVSDLQATFTKIKLIFGAPSYAQDGNSQSVVEICLARITSAIRETCSIDSYAPGLVDLLESCLNHDLKPKVHSASQSFKEQDTPYSKIASDLLSCLFLHYSKQAVMTVAIPSAVKVLQKGSADLIRNTSCYLSLAAIHNARLLSQYSLQIIASITAAGNHSLVRVLPQVYPENREPFHAHLPSLLNVLEHCDYSEKLSLLQLCALIAKLKPEFLVPYVCRIRVCLNHPSTCSTVLHLYLTLITSGYAIALKDELRPLIKAISESKISASNLNTAIRLLGALGKQNKHAAQDAVSYLVVRMEKADAADLPMYAKEIETIAEKQPDSVSVFAPQIQQLCDGTTARHTWLRIRDLASEERRGAPTGRGSTSGSLATSKGDSTSTLSSHSRTNVASPPAGKPSVSPLPQPFVGRHDPLVGTPPVGRVFPTRCTADSAAEQQRRRSSSQGSLFYLTRPTAPPAVGGASGKSAHQTVDFPSSTLMHRQQRERDHQAALESISIGLRDYAAPNADGGLLAQPFRIKKLNNNGRIKLCPVAPQPAAATTSSHVITTFGAVNDSVTQRTGSGSALEFADSKASTSSTLTERTPPSVDGPARLIQVPSDVSIDTRDVETQFNTQPRPTTTTTEKPLKPAAKIESKAHTLSSTARPDAVKQFSEKHLPIMREYVEDIDTRYPIPLQVTVEESGYNKQRMRVYFSCQAKGTHCFYGDDEALFVFKTRLPQIWLHLMFLHLQVQSVEVLGQNDEQVQKLKSCWECLPSTVTKNRPFSVLVTGAFPPTKDQNQILKELQAANYYDAFVYDAIDGQWACFACNRPDKVRDFMRHETAGAGAAVLQGQLKEKKGRWKFFKRWQTKYFTLSSASLSYREDLKSVTESGEPIIDLKAIRSVKSVSRRKNRKSLPKAFEIFTSDETSYILKAKDRNDAETWLHCLQMAVAQAQKKPEVSQL